MSFSGDTKRELCRDKISRRCCARAEAYGVLLFCNSFSPREIKIITESSAFAERLALLFPKAFHVSLDQGPAREGSAGKQTLAVSEPAKLAAIWEAFGYDSRRSLSHHINFAVLEEPCCRASFLRGAFLAGGSVTDPEKNYHLELVTSHYSVSRELTALLQEMELASKSTTRKSNYITYFKQSEHIEEFLTLMGAPLAAMKMMNAKVEKNLRGSINRRVNCDAANMDKVVDAAQEQIAAIRLLEETVGLDSLSDKLREAAGLRIEYPELTLTQIAELCDPPVTKSCLNHRLRKLVELSKL
ncbi:putative sporulation transcription regulator WhiA [bioreactor metagenome]|uniref:Putative sporulation transcription regulator WhiA n=1 Tax=bioreactor metagenome TaxID=1076179 RepID=A0A645AL58_9ZZZZ